VTEGRNDRVTPARAGVVEALTRGGCVAPEEEADALLEASHRGVGSIDQLLSRRLGGEPLAWIVGRVRFCDVTVLVHRGVFVPRPHTEPMAYRAISQLPHDGVAIDLCTGSGAIAVAMRSARPGATVLATDVDARAVACARSNGIEAFVGDLDGPLPHALRGSADVITAVVPYVPLEELHLLPRDVLANEPRHALDGGPRGTAVLLRVADVAARWLAPGGTVLLEIGGDQAKEMAHRFGELGMTDVVVHRDDEGAERAIEARRPAR
jgi:release factor glutamine methyltransferase